MNRVGAWMLGLTLTAAALTVTVLTPPSDAGADLFLVDAQIGARAEGRNLAATILDVRLTEEIGTDDGWTDEGNWLVVDVTAEAVVSQVQGLLSDATLQIGGRTFTAVERGPTETNLLNTQLLPGVAQTGSLLFELPDDALDDIAVLHLATGSSDFGDSILQLQIDLHTTQRTESVTLSEVEWTAP